MKQTVAGISLLICSILFMGMNKVSTYSFAVLKYNGGGDWYANPSAVPNLVKYCNTKHGTSINESVDEVEVGSKDIFSYPFIHMTGHGNVVFNSQETKNLQSYLKNGGFLHIDDNYGMDKFIRPQLKNLLPNTQLVELPFTHELFKQPNAFPKGLPKIHEHDKKAPQAFALLHENRVVLLYTYECDLGDGWEDPEVHNDSPEKRKLALKMGANIVQYALTH